MSDAEYLYRCEAMRVGSQRLLEAIQAARAGTCVITPLDPVKLPRDPAPAKEHGYKGSAAITKPETQDEAILRLFASGASFGTIAKKTGLANPVAAHNALQRLRRKNPGTYWRALERHNKARGLVR